MRRTLQNVVFNQPRHVHMSFVISFQRTLYMAENVCADHIVTNEKLTHITVQLDSHEHIVRKEVVLLDLLNKGIP